MVLQQQTRQLKISPILGDEDVHLIAVAGREELSRLYEFQLEILSMNDNICADEIVGQNVTVLLEWGGEVPRYFNGYVRKFLAADEVKRHQRRYLMTIVPWLWFLTQRTDCRIFQDMTVVEIIEEVFGKHGYSAYQFKLKGEYAAREYCVQYRESDFDFVSRLLEEEGIFYYFQHDNGAHTMILADHRMAWTECEDSPVDCPDDDQQTLHLRPHIMEWQHQWQFHSGAWAHGDYNFKTPRRTLHFGERTLMKIANATGFERFDFPGCFADREVGMPLARIRMEEIESGHELITGTSSCKSFHPGGKFTIGQHRIESEERKSFVLKLVEHQAHESNSSLSGSEAAFSYQNSFHCFPDAISFRPERLTPKAIMRGCQTAIVTGPPDEEIHTDEFGRVKVKFHWDRWGHCDDRSSCWVRVSQPHAGAGWGHIDLPRVGEEVIVDFLEGDPDRPIIVGRVYNGCNQVPYNLPQNKTISGYKSKSYKEDGKNEMLIDDTAGKEQIVINAQKDMHTTVANDQSLFVGNNRNEEVTTDDGLKVGGNKTTLVTGESYTSSGGLMSLVSDTEVFIGCGDSYIRLSPGEIEIGSKIIRILGDSMVSTEALLINSVASGQNIIKGGVVIIN